MNDSAKSPEAGAPVPFLVFPTGAAVLDGSKVTFRWDPVTGATGYRLEVTTDQTFDSLVVEVEVGTATWQTVEGAFDTGRVTYFWRVIAHKPAGDSLGEIVESFVSTTAEDAASHHFRPAHAEKLGPVPELVTGGTEDVLYLKSRDVSTAEVKLDRPAGDPEAFYDAEEAMAVEHEGLEFGQIWRVVYTVIAAIVFVIVVLFFWMRVEVDESRSASGGLAVPGQLRDLKAEAAIRLGQYALVDAENGVYRIPIERAMDVLAAEHLTEVAPENP